MGLYAARNPAVSRDLGAQKDRWSGFLSQWERALGEDRERICLGDININHLEWTRDDFPPNKQTLKLKPLISELFSRIIPHGVSQLVTTSTVSGMSKSQGWTIFTLTSLIKCPQYKC